MATMLNGLRNRTLNIYTPLSSDGIQAYAAQINEPKKTTKKTMPIAVKKNSSVSMCFIVNIDFGHSTNLTR
jgi:hypothetical protein